MPNFCVDLSHIRHYFNIKTLDVGLSFLSKNCEVFAISYMYDIKQIVNQI